MCVVFIRVYRRKIANFLRIEFWASDRKPPTAKSLYRSIYEDDNIMHYLLRVEQIPSIRSNARNPEQKGTGKLNVDHADLINTSFRYKYVSYYCTPVLR
jgi:hypothetical protein